MNDDETPKNQNLMDSQDIEPVDAEAHGGAEDGDDNPPEDKVDANGISAYVKKDSIWTNLILAALFCNFLYYYYLDFVTPPQKFSSFLMMIQVFFIIVFFVYRDYPKRVSFSPQDWGVALGGTWLPMLILPVQNGLDIPIFYTFQFLGILISIAGILSLNNSFGIVPAVRKVKTGGLYRFVRHPIYFGYAISFSCMVINNFTIFNFAVFISIIACDVMRILAEEKILSEDPMYELYKSRVRYRLIPYVW